MPARIFAVWPRTQAGAARSPGQKKLFAAFQGHWVMWIRSMRILTLTWCWAARPGDGGELGVVAGPRRQSRAGRVRGHGGGLGSASLMTSAIGLRADANRVFPSSFGPCGASAGGVRRRAGRPGRHLRWGRGRDVGDGCQLGGALAGLAQVSGVIGVIGPAAFRRGLRPGLRCLRGGGPRRLRQDRER